MTTAANPQVPNSRAKLNLVVAKAIADPVFLKRLQTDTHAVLEEHGLPVPANVNIHVIVEGKVAGKLDKYLVIPAVTTNLDSVSGGASSGSSLADFLSLFEA